MLFGHPGTLPNGVNPWEANGLQVPFQECPPTDGSLAFLEFRSIEEVLRAARRALVQARLTPSDYCASLRKIGGGANRVRYLRVPGSVRREAS